MLGCWGPKALGGWRVEHWHSRLGLGGNAPAPAGFTSRGRGAVAGRELQQRKLPAPSAPALHRGASHVAPNGLLKSSASSHLLLSE